MNGYYEADEAEDDEFEPDDGRFPHQCEEPGCVRTVEFDDEPKCFTHSPDSGSNVRGYSARARQGGHDEDWGAGKDDWQTPGERP